MHLFNCPACGPFGLRGRKRNRHAADQDHIRWAAQLATEIREERRRKRSERFHCICGTSNSGPSILCPLCNPNLNTSDVAWRHWYDAKLAAMARQTMVSP